MIKSKINRTKTKSFSEFSNQFLYDQEKFKDLISSTFSIESFETQINLRRDFGYERRELLVKTLEEQYKFVETTSKVLSQISSLKDSSTFTVTTGHQLNIFTGPIYFIYKIIHTIKLSEELNQKYPENYFVPIFWMASEDHDFDEINHIYLFNKKIEWNQSQGGAVGEYKMQEWEHVLDEVKSFFSNYPDSDIFSLLDKYNGENLSQASFSFVNEIFKDFGLVILDANHKELKTSFSSLILKELESSFSQNCVEKSNKKFESLGFSPQIHAREINLFYLVDSDRLRIIKEGENYIIDSVGTFSIEEMKEMVEKDASKFSPNVVLRPVYQETILPNLAYIGGGAEIAYWTQLKGVFDEVKVLFPLIQVRNSVQIFDSNAQKKLKKLTISIEDIFMELENLKKIFVAENITEEIDFSVLENSMISLSDKIESQIVSFDKNLSKFAEAEKVKLKNQIENIKQKLVKQQKNLFDVQLKQIEDLKNKLFPNAALQERRDNFLNFAPDGDYKSFIKNIYDSLDVFEKDLIVLELD
jgi:bacillithiol biosynthesis cysteine-adding enzyme BshC